ncbi:MAG TPA: DUF5698 domain-containing protein [Planctomycetota bacterium]|nr:DUF5698 domain-containing protein [Planctomycetota bacterium]
MTLPVLLTCAAIVVGRVVDVTLGTLRTVFVVHGRRGVACVLGFFELLIWVVVVSRVVHNLDKPIYAVCYATGFALGTYLGITVEAWFGAGDQVFRAFTRLGDRIAAELREKGYVVTLFHGTGKEGPISMLFVQAPRRRMRPVIEHVVRADPECFYLVDDIRLSSGRKVRFQPPTGWRALFRKK